LCYALLPYSLSKVVYGLYSSDIILVLVTLGTLGMPHEFLGVRCLGERKGDESSSLGASSLALGVMVVIRLRGVIPSSCSVKASPTTDDIFTVPARPTSVVEFFRSSGEADPSGLSGIGISPLPSLGETTLNLVSMSLLVSAPTTEGDLCTDL
jgi:hypothetical protein